MPSYSRPSLTVHTADSVNDTLLYNPPIVQPIGKPYT